MQYIRNVLGRKFSNSKKCEQNIISILKIPTFVDIQASESGAITLSHDQPESTTQVWVAQLGVDKRYTYIIQAQTC